MMDLRVCASARARARVCACVCVPVRMCECAPPARICASRIPKTHRRAEAHRQKGQVLEVTAGHIERHQRGIRSVCRQRGYLLPEAHVAGDTDVGGRAGVAAAGRLPLACLGGGGLCKCRTMLVELRAERSGQASQQGPRECWCAARASAARTLLLCVPIASGELARGNVRRPPRPTGAPPCATGAALPAADAPAPAGERLHPPRSSAA